MVLAMEKSIRQCMSACVRVSGINYVNIHNKQSLTRLCCSPRETCDTVLLCKFCDQALDLASADNASLIAWQERFRLLHSEQRGRRIRLEF